MSPVSIRSPHRSKGRPAARREIALIQEFQSAPLTEARGDSSLEMQSVADELSFNPLPSPKQGETGFKSHNDPEDELFQSAPLTEARGDREPLIDPISSVSIRSPHRSKGRLPVFLTSATVSIRSPHRSKGRLKLPDGDVEPIQFQSAPLTEARGDFFRQGESARICRFNPLPSPKQGETL